MFTFLGLAAQIIGMVPGLESLAAKWHSDALDAKVKMMMAKTGADRDTTVALLQANAQVQTKWWFVAVIPVLLALPTVAYVWKGIFFDNVLALLFGTCAAGDCVLWGVQNSTPALGGFLNIVSLAVIGFYLYHGSKES